MITEWLNSSSHHPMIHQEDGGGTVPASLIAQIWVRWPDPPGWSLRRRMLTVQVGSANQQCMMQDVLQKKSHRMARGRAPGWNRGHLNRKLVTRGQPCKDLRTEQAKSLIWKWAWCDLGREKSLEWLEQESPGKQDKWRAIRKPGVRSQNLLAPLRSLDLTLYVMGSYWNLLIRGLKWSDCLKKNYLGRRTVVRVMRPKET